MRGKYLNVLRKLSLILLLLPLLCTSSSLLLLDGLDVSNELRNILRNDYTQHH